MQSSLHGGQMSISPGSGSTIQPRELYEWQRERALELIDVRTPAEFGEVHVQGARNIPLGDLRPGALLQELAADPEAPIAMICRSGARAEKACQMLRAAGATRVVNVEGGTLAWIDADLPVVRGRRTISLERQVRIAAGALVLGSCLGAWLLHPALIGMAAFVGAGLVFAGITDTCGMGLLLARMPWNRLDKPADG